MGIIYGYIRVSSQDQNEDRQFRAMEAHGISRRHIFSDKMSGKDFHRPGYQALLAQLKPGDVLSVASLDRLGRNYQEILAQWELITRQKKADIVVFNLPLLDTRLFKDLVGTLIADLVLLIMSYMAETERENIRLRQAEGIAAAKARGVQFGRRPQPVPRTIQRALKLWSEGLLTTAEAAKLAGKARSTFCYHIKKAGLSAKKRPSCPVPAESESVTAGALPASVMEKLCILQKEECSRSSEAHTAALESRLPPVQREGSKRQTRLRARSFLKAFRLWRAGIVQTAEAARLPAMHMEDFLYCAAQLREAFPEVPINV